MSVINANPLMLGDAGYNIQRSLRFRASASAYLNRTPAVAGNGSVWTYSAWVKRGQLGQSRNQYLMTSIYDGALTAGIYFNSSTDTLTAAYYNGYTVGLVYQYTTSQVFRDPSAWYHIVVSSNGGTWFRIYVNGVLASVSTTGSASTASIFNQTYGHQIGAWTYAGTNAYFDGLISEMNWIDGQALTPSSFGQTDAVTGVWTPKKYTGTYGTNGFYLPFSDNTSATTLAYDKSGNSNNWTPNNISTTAGQSYDSMLDVPTLTSATAANYCVLNPLSTTSNISLSDANLGFQTTTSASWYGARGTFGIPTSGKWYFEVKTNDATTIGTGYVGVMSPDVPVTTYSSTGTTSTMWGYVQANGNKTNNGSSSAYGNSWAASGDVVGVAVDMDNLAIYFAKNNTWQNSGDPTSGASKTGAAFTNLSGVVVPMIFAGDVGKINANFGQRPFSYTPPTGFKALNTFNLPDPTIKKPNQYMDATLWTGNGTSQSITNSGSFQPDLVWAKDRNNTGGFNHCLVDSVRGTGLRLRSNTTDAEASTSSVTAFNSNGFSIGSYPEVNQNTDSFVGWQWKKGATPGFDIVTYTGNGANRTVAHSLGVAPSMIIVKGRSSTTNNYGMVYHASRGATKALYLSLTNAEDTASNYWQDTAPTSSVFSVGTYTGVNNSSQTYVAYLFAEIAGFSKFGSYTGNGSSDGPFVYCGFRPKYVMIKRTDAANHWLLYDTARDTYNAGDKWLRANASDAESTGLYWDGLSNGFKIRVNDPASNASGGTYIYAAFAENPFKYSLAR